MISQAIDTHDIDQGLDRKQLTQLKQRFLALNQARLARASESLSEHQQQFLQLLPLLFHINHPQLPGYVKASTPAGVFAYEPDKATLRLVKALARSFSYTRDISDKKGAIEALFIMGSVGSIGYSQASDLDIWVCHSPELGAAAVRDLELKCELISRWAAEKINLEVHFFAMTAERFQAGHTSSLSSEASGSAQHFLLLDEFYRTALWIAGKLPLWWFVPSSQEANYADYTHQLLHKRFIKAKDVIDFGGVARIPANEFIGAGIWQLYKAIESPHKSVLKLMLIEVYASAADQPQTARLSEPLSLSFKTLVYQGQTDANLLDPYVMAYRRVEALLQAQAAVQRLELARRCFYFKVNKPLSKKPARAATSWQRPLLEQLVADFNWSEQTLQLLDQRAQWKAPEVIAERALLVNELHQSYRLLLELNRRQEHQAAISADELMILGRKLHAAFERKAGKIEAINPGISRDLSEPALCLVQMAGEGEENWQLLRGTQQELNTRAPTEPIKRARSLLELLLWSQVNGLLVRGTKVDIVSKHYALTGTQQQNLLQRLQQWQPAPSTQEHQVFTRAAATEQLLWVINLGVEPQAGLLKKGLQLLSSQRDALGFSGFKENLVLTADLVIRNSWGEITVRRFARDALVNALLYCLRLVPPARPASSPQLRIECLSLSQGSSIAQRLGELWREIISCYTRGARPLSTRYLFEMGDEYLLLQFLHQQPHLARFSSYQGLLEKLAQPQADYSALVADSYALRDKPLGAICQVLKNSGVFIFFQVKGAGAELTLVDDKGSVFRSQSAYYNQEAFLHPLLRFIESSFAQLHWSGDLSAQKELSIAVFELDARSSVALIGSRQLQYQVRKCELPSALENLHSLQVKVIAEPDQQGDIGYSILCNEQEFSTLAFGADIYTQVASYIMHYRQTKLRYPCYISELDLSQCRDIIAQQTGLQLSHYLQIKMDLEARLNSALAQL